jgi:hypothetical protein
LIPALWQQHPAEVGGSAQAGVLFADPSSVLGLNPAVYLVDGAHEVKSLPDLADGVSPRCVEHGHRLWPNAPKAVVLQREVIVRHALEIRAWGVGNDYKACLTG